MDDAECGLAAADGVAAGFPLDSYLPILALIRFKCCLMLSDDQRISRWLKTECPQIAGMNIVHFETALHYLLSTGSFPDEQRKYENAVLLIQRILDHLDIERAEKEENVTLDVLTDFVRFVRLSVSYQLKLTPFDAAKSGHYLHRFGSVADRIDRFNETENNDEAGGCSQGLLLDDELRWFMSRSWNFGVSICSKRRGADDDDHSSSLEAGKSWLEIAVRLSRHIQSATDSDQGMMEQMKSAVDGLKAIIYELR